jgi:hypothetical protein
MRSGTSAGLKARETRNIWSRNIDLMVIGKI